jgi:hypothetical protein
MKYTMLMNDTTVDYDVFSLTLLTDSALLSGFTSNTSAKGVYNVKFYTFYGGITYMV